VRRRDRYVFYDIDACGDREQFYRPILRDCEPALSKSGGLGSRDGELSIAMDIGDARFSVDQRLMLRDCECRFDYGYCPLSQDRRPWKFPDSYFRIDNPRLS
jgi:hypothetical protein